MVMVTRKGVDVMCECLMCRYREAGARGGIWRCCERRVRERRKTEMDMEMDMEMDTEMDMELDGDRRRGKREKGECGHVAMMLLMIDLCESVSPLR
jgi:hypothetical protein